MTIVRPADYPPPFSSAEAIGTPTDPVEERLGDVPVAVLEKGKQPGSHLLSGAVVNPRALRRLFRGSPALDAIPTYGPVEGGAVYLLTKGGAGRIPPPPTMRNHGNWIVSGSQLRRILVEQAG